MLNRSKLGNKKMTEKYNILLVDDEEDNLALLYRTLRGSYNLDRCTSPLKALDMLDEKHYELVISDHKMPEMDGVEFLKKVLEKSPGTMRILLTAYSDANILIDAINYAKIYRYIKKPYNPDELQLIVSAALEYYQLKHDNDKLIEDLKELFSGTIKAIMGALDARESKFCRNAEGSLGPGKQSDGHQLLLPPQDDHIFCGTGARYSSIHVSATSGSRSRRD